MYFDNDKKSTSSKHTKFYELFGLDGTASSADIRKAYKKLLIKCHPDKGGDPVKFQEIQNAYEVLSDPNSKEIYDKYGEEGLKKGGGQSDSNLNKKAKAPSMLFTIRVNLEDIYTGLSRELEITRDRCCKACKGTGSKSCSTGYTCSGCRGTGQVLKLVNTNFGMMQSAADCSACGGKGTTISEDDKCGECKFTKLTADKKILIVEVEKGAPDGCRYTFSGEGNEKPGFEVGDVNVEIFLENKTKFERKGADLATTIDITIIEALTQFEIELKHLDGRTIYIQNKKGEVIQPGVVKTVKEAGLPFHGSPYKFGNLYVSFNVTMPKLEKEAQDALLEVRNKNNYLIRFLKKKMKF